jgi:thiol-disulfide isomerase/thioredoxin
MPTWESFVKQQKANGNSKVSFKKVNMDLKENKSLRSKYDIVSYPTILLHLSNGNVKKFENERT